MLFVSSFFINFLFCFVWNPFNHTIYEISSVRTNIKMKFHFVSALWRARHGVHPATARVVSTSVQECALRDVLLGGVGVDGLHGDHTPLGVPAAPLPVYQQSMLDGSSYVFLWKMKSIVLGIYICINIHTLKHLSFFCRYTYMDLGNVKINIKVAKRWLAN